MFKNKRYLKVIVWTMIIIFVIVRASSIFSSAQNFMQTLEPIYHQPFVSTSQKMSMKYPRYYNLIQEIKSKTPENSTIYLPAVNLAYGVPMWALGQLQMTQTLLYPRTIKKYTGLETAGYLVYFTDSEEGITELP